MKIGTLALAAIGLATATAASAASTENPFARDSAVLQLKGLDLSSVDGQQRLAIRMDAAARTVCGDRLSSVHLALADQARACRANVIADIRSQIEARHVADATTGGARLAALR